MDVRARAARLAFLALPALGLGCAEPRIDFVPARPPQPFVEMKKEVSRIRGLSFLRDVDIEPREVDEIRALLAETAEAGGANRRPSKVELYRRLGLLPESAAASEHLFELDLFRNSVRYDSRTGKIQVPQGPLPPGLEFLRVPGPVAEQRAREILLVHALTHALHEQHFHWRHRLLDQATPDRQMAWRAVMIGDATLVGLVYLAAGEEREKIIGGVKSLLRSSTMLERQLPHLPDALRRELAFEHLHGTQFVLWAHAQKGWQGVNFLFSRPPVSSAQILHPEKYYVRWEEPLQIIPWRLLRLSGAEKLAEETLGELTIRTLLSQSAGDENAERIAARWTGDTLVVLREREARVLGWITAWQSPAAAREFFFAYRPLLERRHGVALADAGGGPLLSPENAHPILIEVRDNFVLMIDGLSRPRSTEIAAELWSDLEATRESRRIPYDLVRRP